MGWRRNIGKDTQAKIDERYSNCLWINSMIFRMQGVTFFYAVRVANILTTNRSEYDMVSIIDV